MRHSLAAIFLAVIAAPVAAQTDYSVMIRDGGLAETARALETIANPTPSDQFALGGVRFLGAVETALQQLYASDINSSMAQASGLPFLRLPLPENPDATAFRPELIADVFETALADLGTSLTALDTITDQQDVTVVINTADLWFDINSNQTRDPGEDVFGIAGGQLSSGLAGDLVAPVVRFDTSDAAWLSAYAHLLSGISETILALDPTTAITRVTDASAALATFGDSAGSLGLSRQDAMWVDLIAMFIHAVEGQPDVTRSRAAHAHFLDMIADNRTFWARLASETDNTMEWIPNPDQTSALPLPFPDDIGPLWQEVLADAEGLLTGDLLVPHWRLDTSAGINLAAAFQNPPEIDIISLFQGEGILPYTEKGIRISNENLNLFTAMMGGNAALYMVLLN